MASNQPSSLGSGSLADSRWSPARRRSHLSRDPHLPSSSTTAVSISISSRIPPIIRAPPLRDSSSTTIDPPPPYSSQASTASSGPSIHSEEQIRLRSIENENLKRISRRLKREARLSLSTEESKRRLADLEMQLSRSHKVAIGQMPKVEGHFAKACATDLLFLIDTTYSMSPYIEAAKNQVSTIVQELNAAFFHKATLQVAIVGYKDHGDNPHLQALDFTSDIGEVVAFLASLSAKGGGDVPEDVLGALQGALGASWKSQNRCIIHITDAPAHGRTLHDFSDLQDRYAEPGSEPHGLTHSSILQQMIDKNIHYSLLRINNSTDRMAYAFYQAYAPFSTDSSLLVSNKYAVDCRRPLPASPVTRQNVKLLELELGVSYHSLCKLVVQSVTLSVTNSATVHPCADSGFTVTPARRSLLFSSTNTARRVPVSLSSNLETGPPQWETPGWLNEKTKFVAYSTEVLAHDDRMLDKMLDSHTSFNFQCTDLVVSMRKTPFSKGAMRSAFYARSGVSRRKLVVKTYLRQGKTFMHLIDDMLAQALCKAFALEFNTMLPEQYSLDFIVVTCLTRLSDAGEGDAQCMSLEPLIKGEYTKYNSNNGWVNKGKPDHPIFQAAQAFSHFTFERSRGNFMVTDLQGVGRVLTDPALQTLDRGYLPLSGGNLSIDGFYWFFSTHECNSVCSQLGLLSTRDMFVTGDWQFREDWPTRHEATNMLVCCSNKLCSRIVRTSQAGTSDDFPGYRWCRECWGELEATKAMMICTAPGTRSHQFEYSRFFYESQGQPLPRLCPKHREGGDDSWGSSASTWNGEEDTITCKFLDECTDMECCYAHPSLPCPRGRTCEEAACTNRHPMRDCIYKDRCRKTVCVFRHPGGLPARSAPSDHSSPRVETPRCKKDNRCTNPDCVYSHSVVLCPQGACCRKTKCPNRHPKKAAACRDGGECLNTMCVFYHPPSL